MMYPWIAYGQTYDGGGTHADPAASFNGLIGEAQFPYTVPCGKVLRITAVNLESIWGANARIKINGESLFLYSSKLNPSGTFAAIVPTSVWGTDYWVPAGSIVSIELSWSPPIGALYAWGFEGETYNVNNMEMVPWIVHGNTSLGSVAINNPQPSLCGLVGEIDALPYTVPIGKALHITRVSMYAMYGSSLFIFTRDGVGTQNVLTFSSEAGEQFVGTQTWETDLYFRAGAVVGLAVSAHPPVGIVYPWAVSGELLKAFDDLVVPPPPPDENGETVVTWNPNDRHHNISLSNENLTATGTERGLTSVRASLGHSSGKRYFELEIVSAAHGAFVIVGAGDSNFALGSYLGESAASFGHDGAGNDFAEGCSIVNDPTNTHAAGDIIGVAIDLDVGKAWLSINGEWLASGDPIAGTKEWVSGFSGVMYPAVSLYSVNETVTLRTKASQLTYAAPTGFDSWAWVE